MKIIRNSIFAVLILATGTFTACTSSDAQSTDEENTAMTTPPKEIPLKDFFKNPEKSSFQISPDGNHFAYMAPYEKRMNVFVRKVGEQDAKRITEVTDRDIAGYTWANNERILYLKDEAGDENFALYGVNLDGSNYQPLTAEEGVRTRLIDDLEGQDDYILIGLNKRNAQVFDPYRLNIETGEMEMLYENPGNISGWMTDHDGKLRVAITTDGVSNSLLYRETEDDDFETVLTTNFKETMNPQFFTFDNKNLYAISNLGRDRSAAVLFDIESGEEKKVLFEHPEVDVSYIAYSDKRKVLTAAGYTTDKRHRKFFDDESKKMMENLEKQLPGVEVAIGSSNDDETKFIVRTYNDKTRGAYYFYDKENNELEKIVEVSPWLEESEMAGMKPIQYKSRDGLTIHGYLTVPKGRKAKNLPTVLNVHGGPWARDSWGFNPEVQFLANRGYAVLQVNFRGSTGYGKEFWQSSFKEWGQTMQNDLTDGVKWLIGQGIADPERVAIYGGSYGGYATLAGLAYTPEVYACGVDYVGVSNLFTFLQTIPPYWKPFLDMMHEMVGDPEEDSTMLANYSPALNADKIEDPLFIAQGAQDPRVNKAESDQMVEAMKARGVDVQYMVKENEGHGFRNEENRFDFYEAMIGFLNKHIGEKG